MQPNSDRVRTLFSNYKDIISAQFNNKDVEEQVWNQMKESE